MVGLTLTVFSHLTANELNAALAAQELTVTVAGFTLAGSDIVGGFAKAK